MQKINWKRTYVKDYPSVFSDEGNQTGFVYTDGFLHPSFEDHPYITEANHKDGKYHLLLERDEWLSDNLQELEAILTDWYIHSYYGADQVDEIIITD